MRKGKREPGDAKEPGFTRLPAGRHGLPRDYVVENQRARLLVGIVRAVARRGYNAATISEIADAASVSRQTFYDNFDNKEQCFLAAYGRALDDVQTAMAAAAGGSPIEWPGKVTAALGALLDFFASESDLARFFWLEPVGAGEAIVARHRKAMRALIEPLIVDRPAAPDAPRLSETAEEALVGGFVSLISKRVSAGETGRLRELLPDLRELVSAPYMGSTEPERRGGGGG